MADIQNQRPGGMAAVVGLDRDAVTALCEEASSAGEVAPANLNTPTQGAPGADRPDRQPGALGRVRRGDGRGGLWQVRGAWARARARRPHPADQARRGRWSRRWREAPAVVAGQQPDRLGGVVEHEAHGPTALDVEQECLELIRRAQLTGAKATAAAVAAQRELRDARKAREDAQDAQVRGEDGADERLRAAITRIHLASDQQAAAADENEAAGRVLRSSRARLAQTRETLLDELAEEAERLAGGYRQAAEQLVEPLADLVAKWQAVDARWGTLHAAIRVKIENADRERGVDRDSGLVRSEAAMPEAPIDVATVQRILNTAPRPKAMEPGYDPSRPVEPDAPEVMRDSDGSPLMFDSDLIPQA
jgi:hypothetical protein